MTTPEEPMREHPSTYFVQDRSNEDELTRVKVQDQMITAGMGGPLAEQPDPASFRRVLDIGCGTGGWLTEVARTYPGIELLIGVDISSRFIHYARAQIEDNAALAQRVEFTTMDALRVLEFPDHFFDLVNERFALSYLRTWDWPKYLTECIRVTHPGGVIRFTECAIADSTSSALNEQGGYLQRAFYQAGHFFTDDSRGVINELSNQFTLHGLQNIQTREYTLHFQVGTEQCDLFIQDMTHGIHTTRPFVKKWAQVPHNYDEICKQALREMRLPDFAATWTMLTCWGTTPEQTNDPLYPYVP